MPYVDTHCHLDHHPERTADDQVAAARADGVGLLVDVGTDVASSRQAIANAHRFAGVVAAVGIHPNDPAGTSDAQLAEIDELATDEVVVAVGETGLDHYRDRTTPAQQEASFRTHIDIARRHDRTLVIHCRDAWQDCLRVLEDQGPPSRVVMHCFSGDLDVVRRCVEAGWFLSFAGNVTFRNADGLRLVALDAPTELLLTETDSPFLTPHPHRGKPNEPALVRHTLDFLAGLRGADVAELREAVWANAQRAFGLSHS